MLQLLYQSLEVEPGDPGPNACGSCRTCCTAEGLNRQQVTALELSLLADHRGLEAAQEFEAYCQRRRDSQGQFQFPSCPFLRDEGCSVYGYRPFSCRVFGHYRPRGTLLPEPCAYQGQELEFEPSDYYRVVPGARELRQLSRDFQLRNSPPPRPPQVSGSMEAGWVGLDLEDPWDLALERFSGGEIPELPPASEGEPLFASYVRALVAAEIGDHLQALTHFLRVLKVCPQRADLMTFAGFHAFQLGRLQQAERLWQWALHQDGENPLTYSFLGYLYQHWQRWQLAADFFAAAAELQPEQPLHLQRRTEALARLG